MPQVDPVSSEAKLFLLDVPLIRDSDDALSAATGHYWAAAAYFDPPWRGAVLFSSDDGAVYVAADETLDAVASGVARTALPDTDLPFQTDLSGQLQVTMVSSSLASVSADPCRRQRRAHPVPGHRAFSGGLHAHPTSARAPRYPRCSPGVTRGDLFVLLTGEGVQRRPLALDRVGATLSYRVVGRGGDLRDARTQQLTLAGNDLKPYARAQLEATGSSSTRSRRSTRGRRRTCRCRSIPASPTDPAIIAVYTTLDDTSEVWDLIPMMEFLLKNTTDPNRISFLVTGVYKFRVGVRRSGSIDTITSADLSLRKDGVNA